MGELACKWRSRVLIMRRPTKFRCVRSPPSHLQGVRLIMLRSADQIRAVRSHAETVLAALPTDPAAAPEDVRPALDAIQRAARAVLLETADPPRVGVIGEFSTGKTQLL